MSRRPSARARQRGQAIIETAIVVTLVMTLFIGVYATAVAVSDKQQAGQATRSGARFAAQVGANGYRSTSTPTGCQATAKDPCIVDNQVLRNVLSALGSLNNADSIVVTIFEPCSDRGTPGSCGSNLSSQCSGGVYANGAPYDQRNDPGEIYRLVGGSWQRTAAPNGLYDLSMRGQMHPNEGVIGVQVNFHYASPTPFIHVDLSLQEFTVNCLAPSSS